MSKRGAAAEGADIDPAWQRGLELFEAGHYWESHEALEPLWLASSGLDKELYKGIILLAAALHKARGMKSARGGRRNYAKALARLALLPDQYHGVAVRELEARVHAALRDPAQTPAIPRAPALSPDAPEGDAP